MSNELALTGQRPSYLPAVADPTAASANPYLAGLSSGGISLPFLSFRGKAFRVRKGGEEASLGTSLSVLLVASRPSLSKRYYDKTYVSGEITPPRCWADDGANPQAPDGMETIAPACAKCPMNVFGSGKRQDGSASKGKACGDFKRIVVYPLVEVGGAAMVQAMLLDLPATSFRAKKNEPPAFLEFARILAENGAYVPAGDQQVGAVAAKLTFTEDEFPRLVWSADRWATDDEMKNALEMATSDDVAEALSADGGLEPNPQAAAQPAAIAGAPPAAVAEPAPEPEPEPEPKAEEKPAAGLEDADLATLMAKLNALGGK